MTVKIESSIDTLVSVQSKHPGRHYLQDALDSFTIQDPNGEHQCTAHKPMLGNTQELLRRNPSHRFTEDLLKVFLQRLLSALDYLHTAAHLIHRYDLAPNPMDQRLTGHRHYYLEHSSANRGQIDHAEVH